MPHFNIVKNSEPKGSFRVQSVIGKYDLQAKNIQETFSGDIELPEKWNVGLIVGRSGTGKTTIAKTLFGDSCVNEYSWEHDNILDDMPENCAVNDICQTLVSVGFSSPTSWLKPYAVLSNGEKMRAQIARAMLEDKELIVFDEFTSVVDRVVAQVSSIAISKRIRKSGKRFIAVTCHHDVEQYLDPDWVFNTDEMRFYERKERIQVKKNSKFSKSVIAKNANIGKYLDAIII